MLQIAGVPDELIRVLNERLRELEQTIPAASDASAVLPSVGTPGRFTAGVTDAKGRVIERGRLLISDLPGGGYPAAQVPPAAHSAFYSARSSSIGTVTVSALPAARYLFAVNLGATTSGAGTVAWTFSWVSDGTTRTITSGANTLSPALTTSGLAAVYMINVDAGTSVTYATTYAGPGAYEFSAVLARQ